MNKWIMVASAGAVALFILGLQFLQAADRPRGMPGAPMGMAPVGPQERTIIKVCNWDGVVPDKALDGFKMPAGKWAEYQEQGWHVESYLVAPNADGKSQGLYAVLVERPAGMMPRAGVDGPPPGPAGGGGRRGR